MEKKTHLRIGRVVLAIAILILLVTILFIGSKKLFTNVVDGKSTVFLASENINIQIYDKEYKEALVLPRGTEVKKYEKQITNEETGKTYDRIIYEENEYLIDPGQVVSNVKDVVKETTMYVRTPVTVYQNETDYKILGHEKKGENLSIIGHDYVKEDGSVNMYQIRYEEKTGYVYAKYLTKTEEEALLNYNEDGIYDIHKDRKFSFELYGGSPANLDYYPYEKPSFENNPLMKDAHSFYINGSKYIIGNIDAYISLAKENNVNTFVVDIKDGALAFEADVAKTYSMSSFKTAMNSVENYKKAIDKIKEAGIYVVGRIVVFNDPIYAKDHPEDCISSTASSALWPSAYSRNVWEYNIALAEEAVQKFGFNEIQFDYVRFPESAYSMSKSPSTDFKNKYNEEKAQAVQGFLFYATDYLHRLNVYVSVDVFGECANNYVTAYGQYWPSITNIVDVISAMPYPDHFSKGSYGISIPWENPYNLITSWGKVAATRQKEVKTPAIARTWVQAYNAIHEPHIVYDASKLTEQIKALYETGLTGGYIPWNANSSLEKYQSIASAFKKDYGA